MTDLSPEAQAVLDAVRKDYYLWKDQAARCAAAALHAAADGISYRWAAEEIVAHLDGLAAELENHKP